MVQLPLFSEKGVYKFFSIEDLESFTVPEDKKPYVIMVVGVNGVGKTTTIGKLAYQFKKAGKNVYLGAADTFRAAAVEQLVIWSERVGVPIVKQKMGSDPASVAFDTLSSAKANGADVVIIDTGYDFQCSIYSDIGSNQYFFQIVQHFVVHLAFTGNGSGNLRKYIFFCLR